MVVFNCEVGSGMCVSFKLLINRYVSGALSRVAKESPLLNRTDVVISSLSGPLER